ncbi:peptidase M48-like protein [Thermosporothrix hazakensis]|jgi:Zn-dependent protease with chaperone function|uniref:Peptidase M48-like protein n=2 Tax=Thermosporothrix TaxID=768650 RepID=A0A326U9D5_THEHA|nr:M48 family metallopeptidase [Thermosporothrix hazakensis]PZW32037.1 peptidase M48-like protein [Thermosporothrix hazakensis]BBH91490.1 hypothetical protein KTC_62410 [Thermosporothrix sp. COM3]GCE49635.1 hypothetical protein KTH_45040 [Thermosporothrix hazakensis]
MTTAQPAERRRFPDLDPVALQHPYDRAALNALQKVPGLDVVVRKFIELVPERISHIQHVAQMVQVTPRQCPQLHSLLQDACEILDVQEPELYVSQYPVPNAYTSGHDNPFIVVTTGLLDMMNDDEIMAVLAHELGHIKSGHVLYKTMARSIGAILSIVGDMTLGIGRIIGRTLEGAFLEWDRKSEFTADRAAMLVVQDPDVMLSLMMKLAGGTLFQRDQMNAREFLKQADLYNDVDANMLDRFYKLLLIAPVSHPLIIVRAREIVDWAGSREYGDILEGRYPRMWRPGYTTGPVTPPPDTSGSRRTTSPLGEETELVRCPHCGREQTNRRYCSLCGGQIS